MSYDLMVFDPAGPPSDRLGFLNWYAEVARMGDGKLTSDPATTGPALQAWYRDMIREFPAVNGPDATGSADMDNVKRTEYRFTEKAIIASFQWEASRHALRQAGKVARRHSVGLFDVSGETGAVWAPTSKGHYALTHRNE
jgi:hypothetical protein